MREYSTPLTIDVPDSGSLTDDVVANGIQHPDAVAFSRHDGVGWVDVTAGEFLTDVRAVAKGLLAAGVQQGDRVALMSRTRYEWTLLDYAVWFAGAVTVPIYDTASTEQLGWVLADSGASFAVTETGQHVTRITEAQHGGTDTALRHVWAFDDGAVEDLSRSGREVSDADLEDRRRSITPHSPATIIYTSGTTGTPKGCELTHGNFMFELSVATQQLHELFEDEEASTLLFLPLAHVFARIIQVGAVKARVRLGFSTDVRRLFVDLEEFRPTFVLAVPRIFERIFTTTAQRAAADGRGRTFDRAVHTAIAHSRAMDLGRAGPVLKAKHALFDRLVYAPMRDALGGRCRYAVSGGAPLGDRLGHFYRGMGLVVLEGYGLTETTAAVTANLPDATKIGTVGRPLEGTSLRIADDGELMVRGPQVMAGYWQDEQATAEVLSEGWLHTGDLGEIDDEGFLRVIGRKKEVLVTAGGKNVVPSVLEDRIRAHRLVSQCMVVGDGRPFVAALVTIDPEPYRLWADQHGKPTAVERAVDDPDLRAEISTAVDDANRSVSQAESIRKFAILPVDWTEETGELTPSLKLRRDVVMREFRTDLERLYGD